MMTPIGRILRSHSDPARAYVQLDDEWVAELASLGRCSHVIVLYKSAGERIGLAVVELLRMEDELLTVLGLDAPEGTPVFDIKPYDARVHSVPGAVKG